MIYNLDVGDLVRVKSSYFSEIWRGRPAVITAVDIRAREYMIKYFCFPSARSPAVDVDSVEFSNENYEPLQRKCATCKKVSCPAQKWTQAFSEERYNFIRILEEEGNLK